MAKSLVDHLKDLKTIVNAGNCSVLVGAGFSKNVSDVFLSWGQLLKDIVLELFETEIRNDYEKQKKRGSYKEFERKRISSYISEKGYLQLVSDYIRKKGYAEAIAVYIEQRIPLAVQSGDRYFLRNIHSSAKDIEIARDRFILHSKLIELPWINIYTTNYDNLLEVCVDTQIEKKLKAKIESIDQQIIDHRRQLDRDELRLVELQRALATKEELLLQSSAAGTTNLQATNLKEEFSSDKNNNEPISTTVPGPREIDELIRNIKANQYLIKERTAKRNRLALHIDECYSVVTHSSDLGLKKSKNIIKLHGDLRKNAEAEFGFDSDPRKHYIISNEDYETYPSRHEAFTQLMRISLLQQAFCLFGFSGDDPNFLAWVSWVRDVIQRKRDIDSGTTVKVYMVSVSDESLSTEKKIFFRNHRIQYLPLAQTEVIQFLQTETGKEINKNDKRSLLDAFLDYLNDDSYVNSARIAIELNDQEEYHSYWNQMPLIHSQNLDISKILDREFPWELKGTNRIPGTTPGSIGRKEHLLNWALVAFSALDETGKSEFTKVLLRAIEDYFIAPSILGTGEGSLMDLLLSQRDSLVNDPGFYLIRLKDSVWLNDKEEFSSLVNNVEGGSLDGNKDDIWYYNCLHAAFNLDFTRLRLLLDDWEPHDLWRVRKAGLIALFDARRAAEFLKETGPLPIFQEQLYRVHLQRFLQDSVNYRETKKYTEKLHKLKKEGLRDFDESLEYILSLDLPNQKVKPYGSGKFSFEEIIISGDSSVIRSLQFFGILAEAGFPLAIEKTSLYTNKKIYPLIRRSFGHCPFPILFYALQLGDESFLRRVGQDYVYSETLSEQLPLISKNIQCAYISEETPGYIRKSLLHFYAEIIIGLKPEEWSEFFLRVWSDKLQNCTLFIERHFDSPHLIYNGLKYLTDLSIVRKVITDCLIVISNESSDTPTEQAISYLYYLAQNPVLETDHGIGREEDVVSLISKIIDKISSEHYSTIFALGNIHKLLTGEQKNKIKAKIGQASLSEIENDRIWRIILFFADGDITLTQKIADGISSSPILWKSNITENSASSRIEFIPIHRLRKTKTFQNGIVWNQQQIEVIYSRLKEELTKIKAFVVKRSEINQYEEILLEMYFFLGDESAALIEKDDYEETLEQAHTLYKDQCGFTSINEGLHSSNKSQVILALTQLSIEIYFDEKISSHTSNINLLLNKVLLQSEPALAASLSYVSNWFLDFMHYDSLKQFSDIVLNILKRYHSATPEEMEKPFMQEKLTKLAIVLNAWKLDDPIIAHYLTNRMQSRFNNMRSFREDH